MSLIRGNDWLTIAESQPRGCSSDILSEKGAPENPNLAREEQLAPKSS